MDLNRPVSPIEHWALDPAIVHLNHGSFGGCPRSVLDAANAIRARVEGAPMRFYVLDWQTELDRARSAVAAFIGADPERTVFVPGATAGVALALGAVELAAGDEILTTSHVYPACRYQLMRLAEARGARISFVDVPLPFDPDALVEHVAAAITPRTRLAHLDHITSPTALIYPLERLIPLFTARGIPVLVDGAHAPGQLELDVGALGATWYVGNHHKWLCAPKASGFLVSATPVPPLVVSHGASPAFVPRNRLHAELDWSGTHDPSAQLATPTALDDLATAGGGWAAIRARNHALVLALCDRLGGRRIAPDSVIGSMAAMPITLSAGTGPQTLEKRLLAEGWEVPIVYFPGQPLLRISAHLYNHLGEADALARKLHEVGVVLS